MNHRCSGPRSLLALRFRPVVTTATLLLLGAAVAVGLGTPAHAQTFSNPASIQVPNSQFTQGPASPYGSPITVSGVGSSLTSLTITLANVTHAYPDDLDILLVGPTGLNALLMSDCGGLNPISNLTFTFSDLAAASLSDAGQLASGTFRPTNYDAPFTVDSFAPPAPVSGPYGNTLSALYGADPNGTWNLYVLDDTQGNNGVIAGGWSLTLSAVPEPSVNLLLGTAGLLGAAGIAARRRRGRLHPHHLAPVRR